ncbi:LysE family translocator [Leptolyngbya sp. NK1-12]|uniref:LysE family translocator n=1 Tax=Leptolyngbya sp. NK1-12 TaxID=2547451 RepID=A0AA97AHS0_9CYAN|nr:LysE family translocator [Leptolyngbya sp. NK1-12]WNZ25800.1 LysE family translocator [Leptolyngbya sp. NK1-12]
MPNLSQLYLFSITSIVILLIPGPAVLYTAIQSIKQGRIAGMVAVLGLELGTLFHVATSFGISTLLLSSTTAFTILKWLGAAYLIYLGVSKLSSLKKIQCRMAVQYESLQKIFWQGVIVEVLNPKTMLFFFTFLPQFVDPSKGSIALQMLTLGFLFVGLATFIDLLYAVLAGSVRSFLRSSRWLLRKQSYAESIIYFGLGIGAALSSSTN